MRVSIGLKKPDEEYPDNQYFSDYESVSQVRENVSEIFDQVENPNLTALFTETEDDVFTIMPIVPVTERVFLSMKLMGNWQRQWQGEPHTQGTKKAVSLITSS